MEQNHNHECIDEVVYAIQTMMEQILAAWEATNNNCKAIKLMACRGGLTLQQIKDRLFDLVEVIDDNVERGLY